MVEIQHKEFEDGSYVRLFTDLMAEVDVEHNLQVEPIITPWIKLPIDGKNVLRNTFRCPECGEYLEDDGHTMTFDCMSDECDLDSGRRGCWPTSRRWTHIVFYEGRWQEEWNEERFLAAYPYAIKK